ncbi:hypothetical protein BAE44_0012814 [Dichanthelium oligosanthes]|uniref:Cystatin domain-containing protein n=1 Tax=Dichanthelium oligosanthes TaxID=888268 RepID=A0A1E5VM66_9POAL|nr:hypothetical protein BAE44_0012814 [Dichanthelium oligosanthes]
MRSIAAVLFVVFAAVFVAGAASARFVDPSGTDVPAGTHPPQIGRFAVLVYSMNRNTKLKYVSVSDSDVHAHQGGVRYRMVVTAADASGATAQYQVLVWGIPGTYQWMLLEFKKIS